MESMKMKSNGAKGVEFANCRIEVVTVPDSLREFNNKIEEAKKLQRQADSLVPQLVRMISGRLHHINPKGFHSSSHHQLLMELKKELSNYNGQTARWEKVRQTKIQNEAIFDIYCRMIASHVWSQSMPSEESVYMSIKTAILSDLDKFIECLMDKVEYDYFKAKEVVEKLVVLGMPNPEYSYASAKLSKAKRRRSTIIQEIKRQREDYNKEARKINESQERLLDILRKRGQEDIIDEWISIERRYKYLNND